MRPLPTLGRAAALAAAALCLAAAEPADSPVNVPEPAGLYAGPQRGYTPPTLKGAQVVDAAAVAALIDGPDKPVLIDVAMRDRKPAGFPEGRPWLPVHPSIPGAVWLPNAGAVPLAPEREALFYARVAELTGGDTARPVVVFCHVECWGSWNVGKRLVEKGYTGIRWLPGGVEAWQETHDTANLREDPAWAATGQGER
ncbi:rhodanese-like domain-containing protein [Methylobacterium sp. NEAU 140]|uniref:rhodanese-like domain-containing protein n=1 Tax=Methylobacterium sp. NEAU 140 TaxID=3064945 RepID=UPI0027365003|nr:rhodanese-like domain-containing protein [Methylobacterium sp. NEAU 140]MDP4023994.1 rhodanese-like domain-containing protein [Methylobacterium sp. NEAU 140]